LFAILMLGATPLLPRNSKGLSKSVREIGAPETGIRKVSFPHDTGTKQFPTLTKRFGGFDANLRKPLPSTGEVNDAPNGALAIRQGDDRCSIWMH
jgi:hypothetical protein